MAQFRGHALDAAGEEAQGGEIGGVAVALDDLRGHRVHGQAEPGQGDGLHPGVEMGVAAHGPGDLAHPDAGERRGEAFPMPGKFGEKRGHLHAEAQGLCVDAVGAADHELALVAHGQLLDDVEQVVDVGQDQLAGPGQQQAVRRVHDVRGRAAQVDEAGRGADALLQGRQEGDDVVPGRLLDFEDAVHVEAGLFPDDDHVGLGNAAQVGPGLAHGQFDLEPGGVTVFAGTTGRPWPCGYSARSCALLGVVGRMVRGMDGRAAAGTEIPTDARPSRFTNAGRRSPSSLTEKPPARRAQADSTGRGKTVRRAPGQEARPPWPARRSS